MRFCINLWNNAKIGIRGIPIVFPSKIKYNTTYTSPEKTQEETIYVSERLSEEGRVTTVESRLM